ncbi:MAG: hypothetical protein DRO05_06785 [Thermoproteota archaeon]|nr:MAG: hypothetical protein DRO05_06785 [Candidatus Korarchaeota archaeon]
MRMITIRIPEELKEEMRKYDVNWREIIRRAIEEKIRSIKMEEAVEKIREVRKRSKPVKKGELDAWIKQDRGR